MGKKENNCYTEEEILDMLEKKLTKGELLSNLKESLGISEYEVFGYVKKLKDKNINITFTEKDDDVKIIINNHPDYTKENIYSIKTDVNKNTKIAFLSDLRFGSKHEQIEILNDMYHKFLDEGVEYVVICGNLLEGEYRGNDVYEYGNSLISNSAIGQANHFVEYYPKVKGIKTLFITGYTDHKWSKTLNVGEYIASKRDDMIYLGPKSATITFNNVSLKVENLKKQGEAYTIAYPPQKYARSMPSYEEYDAILLGGTLTAQDFPQIRDFRIFTIPSLVERTSKMRATSQQNTIGAYVFDISYNKNGKLKRLTPTLYPYYVPSKKNYLSLNPLNETSKRKKEVNVKINEKKSDFFGEIDNFYKLLKKEESFDDAKKRLSLTDNELIGIIDVLRQNGREIEVVSIDDELVVRKRISKKRSLELKLPKEELTKKEFLVVSDTHYGSIYSQPSMVNTAVYEAYNRGITDVFHVGDICDGDYSRVRPIHVYEVFLYGATGQLDYTVNTLPKYPGMKWHVITGSHDQTHKFNYGLDFGEELAKRRDDVEYLGQDQGYYYFDNCKIELFHPGGGASRILSSISQNGIDQMASRTKPNLQLRGHYHKVYYMLYRNIHTFLCPCNVDQSSFMLKKEIPNLMGNYFITIWYDEKGNIQYIETEPMIFTEQDVIKNDWENPKKYLNSKVLTKRKKK